MTREELLALVNKEADTTKFKSLSQKTINEELDDVLEDFGDDEAANAKLVTKLANRLKRMDGNLHKNVSDEIKKSKEEAERKKKEEEEERKRKKEEEGKTGSDDKYNELLKEIKALKEANAERDKKAARKATIESVKAGLKDKFDKANLEMNDFFLDTALSKLEISDDADVAELVSTAENIYTADYKRANGGNAVPRKGSSAPSGEEKKLDEHEWDDIKDICKDRATKATVKK
jgi:hypothetical protein|nr:MAG TPA: hypothetical protein [Caudoviricetes sp.]